jgi:uncharacterized membrane protein YgaE (UPF0421/DUF939 family)
MEFTFKAEEFLHCIYHYKKRFRNQEYVRFTLQFEQNCILSNDLQGEMQQQNTHKMHIKYIDCN